MRGRHHQLPSGHFICGQIWSGLAKSELQAEAGLQKCHSFIHLQKPRQQTANRKAMGISGQRVGAKSWL